MNGKLKIILIIFIAILFRAVTLSQPMYGDDSALARVAAGKEYFGGTINVHPPLGNVFMIATTSIFRVNAFALHLPAFLCTILTLILLYYFAKWYYNEKVALIATILLSFSAWHIYGGATNVGGEGVLAFFILASAFVFLKYNDSESWKENILIGVVTGISFLVKETTVIIFGVYILYAFFNKWNWKKSWKKGIWINIGFGCIFILFLAADIYFNEGGASVKIIQTGVRSGIERAGFSDPTLFLHLFSWMKIAFWLTPLFLLLPVLWFLQKGLWKERIKDFSFISVLVYGLFFLFYITPASDKPRYLLVIAPFLAILAAQFLAGIEWTTKRIAFVSIIIILFFSWSIWENMERNIISLDNKDEIINRLKQGNLNVDLGIISETGNSGLVINLKIIIITYVLAILTTVFYIFMKKESWNIGSLLIFLGIGIGFNLFIAEEYLFHWTSPDYGDVSKQIGAYVADKEWTEPIILVKDPSLDFYFRDKYDEFYLMDTIANTPERLDVFPSKIEGATVVVVDMPFIDRNGELWSIVNSHCVADFVVLEKGLDVGYVWRC